MSGYCATGSARIDNRPTSAISSRDHPCENRAIDKETRHGGLPFFLISRGRRGRAGAARSTGLISGRGPVAPFSTTTRSPPVEALGDDPVRAQQPMRGHRHAAQFAIVAGHQQIRAAGAAQQGVARHQVGVVVDRLLQPYPHAMPGGSSRSGLSNRARMVTLSVPGSTARSARTTACRRRDVFRTVRQQQANPHLFGRYALHAPSRICLLQPHDFGHGLRKLT